MAPVAALGLLRIGLTHRTLLVGAGLYAVHNMLYAAVYCPAGMLADRVSKRVLLAAGCGQLSYQPLFSVWQAV